MNTNEHIPMETENDSILEKEYILELSPVVKALANPEDSDNGFYQPDVTPRPSHQSVVKNIYQAKQILFPGHFNKEHLDKNNIEQYLSRETEELFHSLAAQITLSIRHDCFRYGHACSYCIEQGYVKSLQFIEYLPELRNILATDIRAALDGDPAAKHYDEIIFSYPGFSAILVYRMAHKLYHLDVPLIPRIMTEHAHSNAGIDIHPAAHIGKSFFIDHGTGVVIGETTTIGDRVRVYQGVTLGALSLHGDAGKRLKNKKRHPTIEDDVILYSNATILGGDVTIGARSIIGGNVWITESVPPDTRVILKRPELVYSGKKQPPIHATG